MNGRFWPSCLCLIGFAAAAIQDDASNRREMLAESLVHITDEAASLKYQLGRIEEETGRRAMMDSFVETVSNYYLIPDWVEEAFQVRRLTERELAKLDHDPAWRNKVYRLSHSQDLARSLYLRMRIPWRESYVAYSWLSRVEISLPVANINETFARYGVLQLRPLVSTQSPKLVVGCGDRVRTEQTASYRPNPHFGDDTIDAGLRRNPSVVGLFGAKHILPSGHYQTVFDEAPLLNMEESHWTEAERILRPGGFFILPSYTKGRQLPDKSTLKLHRVLATDTRFNCSSSAQIRRIGPEHARSVFESRLGMTGYLVFAKPLSDGSFPGDLTQNDLPFGITLVEQRSFGVSERRN